MSFLFFTQLLLNVCSLTETSTRRVHISAPYNRVTISKTHFKNILADGPNAPRNSGGAVFIAKRDVYVLSSSFTNNRADTGGAISVLASSLVINSTKFQGNVAQRSAGALFALGSTVEMKNNIFVSNSAQDYYGAILFLASTGPCFVDSCHIAANTAGLSGGAMGSVNTDLTLDSTTFVNNKAGFYKGEEKQGTDINGGAIWFQTSTNPKYTLIARSVVFTNNFSPNSNSADIVLYGPQTLELDESIVFSSASSVLLLSNAKKAGTAGSVPRVTIPSEIAQATHLQVFADDFEFDKQYFAEAESSSFAAVPLPESQFSNSAQLSGRIDRQGHQVRYRVSISINTASFKQCTSLGAFAYSSMGGALYAAQSVLTISDSTFTSNEAEIGGAIAVHNSNVNFYATTAGLSTITSCEGTKGSAIYSSDSVIIGSILRIERNSGSPAFFISGGSTTITSCTFVSNENSAIFVTEASYLTLVTSCFKGNVNGGQNYGNDLSSSENSTILVSGSLDTNSLSREASYKTESNGKIVDNSAAVTFRSSLCSSGSAPGYQDGNANDGTTTNPNNMMYIIIGAAVGVIAIVGVIAFFIFRKKDDDSDSETMSAFDLNIVSQGTAIQQANGNGSSVTDEEPDDDAPNILFDDLDIDDLDLDDE